MTTIVLSKTDFTVAAGQVMTFTNENAFSLSAVDPNDQPSLTVAGDLRVTVQAGASPMMYAAVAMGFSSFYAGSHLNITSSGSIHVDTTAGPSGAIAYTCPGWGAHVLNDGLIEVTAREFGEGLLQWGVLSDTIPSVINHGAIHVTSLLGDATGVGMAAGGTLSNSGTIDVSGAGQVIGVSFSQFNSGFINSGVIRALDSNPTADSVAVLFQSNLKAPFLNSGTIEGDFAIKVIDSYGTSDTPFMDFRNSGQIIGKIDLGGGGESLTNSGSITGDTDLGDGNDLYDGRQGKETGLLSGGAGNDTELGGSGFDNLQGNMGDDSLSGGAGDDYTVGGKDNDQLFGDAGDDIVWGNLGADTLDGGDGNDQVRGGQGDDVLNGGAGNDFVSGDRGADTITGGAGADIFHSSPGAGLDRVLDFHVAEGDRVMLDPGTTFTVKQLGPDTYIDMGNGDQLILVGVDMSTLPPGTIFLG